MPVFNAGSKIKDIYFGNQKIKEAYFGSQLVYSSMPPVVTNGLQIYLDASNTSSYPESGTTWFDISGNNRNFVWNTATFTNATPKYFSTTGRRAEGPASNSVGINNTSGYTIIVVSRTISLTENHAFKFHRTGSGSASRGIAPHLPWVDGNIYFDQGGCCNADQRTNVNWGGNTSTWYMWSFTAGASGRQIIRNTTVLTTNTTARANIDLNATAIELATSNEYLSGGWNAHLGAFLVYNRQLSAAEIQQNYDTLKENFPI
jgi:hypothetical protein